MATQTDRIGAEITTGVRRYYPMDYLVPWPAITESEVVVYSTVQGERMRPVRWTPSSIARSSFDAASLSTETPCACDGTAAKRVKALQWRSVFAGIRAGANSAKKRSETAHHRWSLLMRDWCESCPLP